ncbi:MAG: hypothetical protein M0T83_04635 [Nitrospiraceae bacterium]|nr:hypothetical protein [Nitrospiraceae bacterium]
MKQSRPSLREIVRPPQITNFIEKGVVSPGTGSGSSDPDVELRIPVPGELYEAFLVKISEQGLSLPEAVREMLLDYLMKEG